MANLGASISQVMTQPWLLSLTAAAVFASLRKWGSNLKTAILDGLKGLREIHAAIYEFRIQCAEDRRRHKDILGTLKRGPTL
jgi:hypothetical protein